MRRPVSLWAGSARPKRIPCWLGNRRVRLVPAFIAGYDGRRHPVKNVISLCDQCDWTPCFPGLYFFPKHQQAAEKRAEAGGPDNPAGGLLGQAKRGATEFATSELHGAIACMLISEQSVFQQPASLRLCKRELERGATVRSAHSYSARVPRWCFNRNTMTNSFRVRDSSEAGE